MFFLVKARLLPLALDEALRYAPPFWASTHMGRFPAKVQEIQALLNLLYGYTQGKFNQIFRGVKLAYYYYYQLKTNFHIRYKLIL